MKQTFLPNTSSVPQVSDSGFTQLHILIPFQPSMWEKNKLEKIMRSVVSKSEKLLEKTTADSKVKKGVMQAIEKSIKALDLSSFRKTALISITQKGSQTVYLSGKIKKKFILNRSINLSDLASASDVSPAFYVLHLERERSVLYEYHKHVLITITERKNTPDFRHFYQIDSFLNILQNFQPQPVFITGVPEFVLAYKAQTKMRELLIDIQRKDDFEGNIMASALSNEISMNWNNRKQQFYLGLLNYGNKLSLVNYGTEEINSNITKCNRGIILLDKSYCNKEHFSKEKDKNDFFKKLHRFLSEGNCIFLLEDSTLREKGGIALFKFPQKNFNLTIPVKEEKVLL